MKSLLFILLAGYAVRSDENNYYVIEMPEDPPMHTKKPFRVYWNVPTMQCSSKKIHFDNLYEDFGILQNDNDRFKGEKITILYDPGLFPALFKNETSGKFRFRNGGVPQEGDLAKHLDAFKKELDHSIPHKNFSGIGIIDFESWRPVFRQNFGVLQPYKDVSIEIERKLHWWWKKAWLEAEAKRRFEDAARTFMQTTLSVAKQLRPAAKWGFYGFPYCFNMASNNMVEACAKGVPEENDRISWLWTESTALYPSVYSSVQLSPARLAALIRGRVGEAARCAGSGGSGDKGGHRAEIFPYFWYRYRDAGFLTETDLTTALSTLYESNATGILIWGSSNDVNTVAKCNKLLNYVKSTFGPAIAKYTKPNKLPDENFTVTTTNSITTDNTDINITTDNPIVNDTSNSNTKLQLDPEFHWNPPENYSQEIINHVDEEIRRKFGHNNTDDNDKHTVLQNNSVLIDLILNAVLNNVDNATSTDILKAKNDKKRQQVNEDSISNTMDINAKTSTETSQVTNSMVTNNPLIDKIYNTSQPLELENVYTTTDNIANYDEATTEFVDKTTYSQTEYGIVDFIDFITTTVRYDDFGTTETDYYATIDDEDDYFFNVDTFINKNVGTNQFDPIDTTTDYETKLTKSYKKDLQAETFESFLKNILETTTDSSIKSTVSDINVKSEDSTEVNEDSTTNRFRGNSKKITEKNEIFESSTKLTDEKDSEMSKVTNIADDTITTNLDNITTEKLETSNTTTTEESTTVMSTSEQVDV